MSRFGNHQTTACSQIFCSGNRVQCSCLFCGSGSFRLLGKHIISGLAFNSFWFRGFNIPKKASFVGFLSLIVNGLIILVQVDALTLRSELSINKIALNNGTTRTFLSRLVKAANVIATSTISPTPKSTGSASSTLILMISNHPI